MANHASALKRARQSETRRIRNRMHKTRLRSAIKDVRAAIGEKGPEKAQEKLRQAVSMIQKSVSNKIIHANQGARRISRLTRQVNQLGQD